MCGYHKTRGPEVCSSSLRRPTASVHTKVVGWLLDALSPSLSFKLVADLHRSRAAEAAKLAKQSPCHEKEASTLRREIERLVSALAQSDDRPGAIVEAITSRQARLKEVEAQATIARLAPDAAGAELDKLQAAAEEAIGMFRAMLDKNPEEARQVVTTFFDRIDFTPVQTPAGPRFKIEGDAKLGRLVGIEGVPEGVAVLTLRPQGDSNTHQTLDLSMFSAPLPVLSPKRVPPIPPDFPRLPKVTGNVWQRLSCAGSGDNCPLGPWRPPAEPIQARRSPNPLLLTTRSATR
jgi:hypothetical protein